MKCVVKQWNLITGVIFFFFSHSYHATWYYQSVIYSSTDSQVNCLKNNIKINIKINIKTAATRFGAVTPSSGSTLLVLAKFTVVKIAN